MLKLKLLAGAVTAGCMLTISMVSAAYASNLAKVTATSVNLRSYNSTEARILGTANMGETLTITGNANNGWFKVSKVGLDNAFISSDYISIYQTDATCIGDNVNVRTSPSPTSASIGTASKGQVFVTSGKCGDWYQIKFNGNTGYIHSDYMQGTLLQYLPSVQAPTASAEVTAKASDDKQSSDDDIYAVVEVPSLNLRADASTDSEIIRSLPSGYNLSVSGYKDGWVLVSDGDDNEGYVKAEYINLKNGKKPDNSVTSDSDDEFDFEYEKSYVNKGPVDCRDLIEYAKEYLGTPYVWGGTDLVAGVDCSGFIYSVYNHFGITLNRTSRDMYTQGTAVSKSELVPGDLLFFNTGGDSVISHVGMYIGEGQYIHSTNGAGGGVTISDLGDSYSTSTYVGAKRILE
ncbi:MAG: SH3 domain-containing protein [Clostridia bacterium]|nr:SH3 domain-containing protein [Clostridia bacterium]